MTTKERGLNGSIVWTLLAVSLIAWIITPALAGVWSCAVIGYTFWNIYYQTNRLANTGRRAKRIPSVLALHIMVHLAQTVLITIFLAVGITWHIW